MVRIMPVDRLSDEEVREILTKYRKIALVGASPKPERDANRVMRYLLEHGYEVYPVNPRYDEVLGRKCYPSVLDIPDEVEIVDLFVRPEFTMDYVEQAIKKGAKVVWFQFNTYNREAFRKAKEAGLTAVAHRCIKQEHERLIG
ncbi:CoA-binding protein [Thermococcus kodakarensis KOD1]|uniref:CoA-binding protein n=1 Tax=Thermococcus kodakarensis (strain ATCC BAA-918 / JCM 12380 / KOD1) TaxID=69014 RepID=Q5JEA3_THEKO|nr:CoA-binding protein [Thermococcus kodakarensis]WCN28130.1 CoA-binding protein [Thermococcus kodakarensis]WCN30427.1 CoA-binding protein [Thermococcus kodakarensis]BAD84194.1 CoA-binding protein [Thermococcus kodakarensis KOD1]